jgi:hypothetical protein
MFEASGRCEPAGPATGNDFMPCRESLPMAVNQGFRKAFTPGYPRSPLQGYSRSGWLWQPHRGDRG